MGTYLEYGRVPQQLQAPLVHALLGTLHIRCTELHIVELLLCCREALVAVACC